MLSRSRFGHNAAIAHHSTIFGIKLTDLDVVDSSTGAGKVGLVELVRQRCLAGQSAGITSHNMPPVRLEEHFELLIKINVFGGPLGYYSRKTCQPRI
jgi:hypothetical protein